ncbi:hypothetical protein FRB99_008201 [Tulasnella sp. 403]|nr:hypothetical protein FRB99_008201 [Tulasnella sp. 403]
MGSKNHEVVPTPLIAQISGLRGGGTNKLLGMLAKRNLVAKVQNSTYDGYRLTYGGYDYLALRTLSKRDSVFSVGNQIGVGKESGEHTYKTPTFARSDNTFTIERYLRRCGQRRKPDGDEDAQSGLIHGDFNEFNILIHQDTLEPVVIDFPQMVSTRHPDAEYYFERDVECIRRFFRRRFGFEGSSAPRFSKVVAEDVEEGDEGDERLDVVVEASGFKKKELDTLEEYMVVAREKTESDPHTRDNGGEADDDDEEEVEEDEEEDEEDSDDEDEAEEVPATTSNDAPPPSALDAPTAALDLNDPACNNTSDPTPSDHTNDNEPTSPPSPSLPTELHTVAKQDVLRQVVNNEISRTQLRQKAKYHSKKTTAGRSRGSKAKQDDRIKVDKHKGDYVY